MSDNAAHPHFNGRELMLNHFAQQSAMTTIALLVMLSSPLSHADDLPEGLRGFSADPPHTIFEGRPGKWDALIRERGWIMKDGGRYRMWYTGYNPDQTPLQMKLGYAESRDGVHWQRTSEKPLFDEVWVEDMMVLKHGERYLMFAEGAGDQAQMLTSADGVKWVSAGPLDVRLSNGDPIPPGPFGTPTVFYEDGVWHLFYERRDQGIWLATSKDLKVWTNVSDAPLITPGPDKYDQLMIAMNQVIKVDGRYYAVMHGTGTPTKPRAWCTYFVVSDDLRTWKKCSEGPVLPVAGNKSSGVLVRDESGFVLYTMHARVYRHRVR